jgi:hypothetical protein
MRFVYAGVFIVLVSVSFYFIIKNISPGDHTSNNSRLGFNQYQVVSQFSALPLFDISYPSVLGAPKAVTENGVPYLEFFPSDSSDPFSMRISFSPDQMKLGETLSTFSPSYVAPNLPRHWIVVNDRPAFCQWLSDAAPVTVCVAVIKDNLLLVSVFGQPASQSKQSDTASFRLMELSIEQSIKL